MVLLLVVGCAAPAQHGGGATGGGTSPGGKRDGADGDREGAQDVRSTSLALDLERLEGSATIALTRAPGEPVSLRVGDLEVESVRDGTGPLSWRVTDGELEVDVAEETERPTLEVRYRFQEQTNADGWLPASGTTLLWPYFCENLFPCEPSPRDGLVFDLEVSGVGEGQVAVYPRTIPSDAPPYALALAVGDYAYQDLGTTPAGTKVGVWHHRGDEEVAGAGTARLAEVFDFLERTYGPYSFGDEVASVSADWRGGAYGGMEHHPYWHVGRGSMDDEVTHAHEAAHGWFGNGVRIRCWEDFVLSEGVTSYAAARALSVVGGDEVRDRVWREYERKLDGAIANGDTVAWPDGCDAIDILHHPLWSSVPYMKGAFFLRAIADEVGAEELDRALGAFYGEHVGRAAGVQDLLDTIEEETGFDTGPLAEAWLRAPGRP